jgi:hypothetical protein
MIQIEIKENKTEYNELEGYLRNAQQVKLNLEWLNNNKDYDVLNYLLSVKNH